MSARSERGAVAPFAAIVMVVILGVAAFAVDLGTQRVARRDMQALADVVALDLAHLLNGRTAAQIKAGTTGFTPLQSAKQASVARNDDTTVGKASDLTVTPYLVTAAPDGSYPVSASGEPIEVAASGAPNAVVVIAKTKVDFGFARVLGFSSGGATRSALATTQSSACFQLGSYAAAINSGDSTLLSPLNQLLGLNLTAVGYQGLANAQVSLADIAADATVGSVDQLVSGNVTMGTFNTAIINVLKRNDPSGNAVAITALEAIQASGVNLTRKVDIAKIVSLQSTDQAALLSNVSVLDLISGSIIAGNGTKGVDISSLNIAGITGSVGVTQGIQRACGIVNDPTAKATASQISASLNVPLTLPTGTSVLGLTTSGSVSVSGGVGNAVGQLVAPPQVTCNAGTAANPDTYRVDVNSGLLGLGVRANLTLNGDVSSGLLGGLLDAVLGSIVKVTFDNVTISLGTTAPGTSTTAQHADLKVPQNAINVTPKGSPLVTGSAFGVNVVPTITTSTVVGGSIRVSTGGVKVLGVTVVPPTVTTVGLDHGPIGSLVTTLLGTLNGVLNTTVNSVLVPNLNALLKPLAKLLGVNAGGADVYSESRPTCNGAKLIG